MLMTSTVATGCENTASDSNRDYSDATAKEQKGGPVGIQNLDWTDESKTDETKQRQWYYLSGIMTTTRIGSRNVHVSIAPVDLSYWALFKAKSEWWAFAVFDKMTWSSVIIVFNPSRLTNTESTQLGVWGDGAAIFAWLVQHKSESQEDILSTWRSFLNGPEEVAGFRLKGSVSLRFNDAQVLSIDIRKAVETVEAIPPNVERLRYDLEVLESSISSEETIVDPSSRVSKERLEEWREEANQLRQWISEKPASHFILTPGQITGYWLDKKSLKEWHPI